MKHTTIWKRLMLLLLAMTLCCACFACSKGDDQPKKDVKPLTDVYADIQSAVTLPDLLELDGNDLYTYVGIPAEAYTEAVALIPTEAILGDMLFLFHAADSDSIKTIESKVNDFGKQNLNEMDNYLPDEYDKIKASSVTNFGDYVWLVVSSDSAKIQKIINDAIVQ